MSYFNRPRIVTDGLVLCLDAGNTKSYPGTGTAWTDISRNNNNSTLNGPVFNSGNGGSIVFDGVNDYVSKSTINVSYLTVSAWAKWTQFFSDLNGHALISNSDADTGEPLNGYLLYQATGAPYNRVQALVYGTSVSAITSNSALSTGTWYNICFTYDGVAVRLYLNGVLDISAAAAKGTIAASSADFIIGSAYTTIGGSYFNGNIASVNLYNKALAATEVLQNFNATRGRFNI